jgi:hypothetical protein
MAINLVKTSKTFGIQQAIRGDLVSSHRMLLDMIDNLHISSIVVGEKSTLICYKDTLIGPLEVFDDSEADSGSHS